MGQATEFDPNNALTQVKRAIKDLMTLDTEDDQDDVHYAANKLNAVLRTLNDNAACWNPDAIREFVLRQHDPLRHLNVKSVQFDRLVRQIQEDMIVKFSCH